jgi:hypothetical protein
MDSLLGDITTKLDKITSWSAGHTTSFSQLVEGGRRYRDLQKEINALNERGAVLQKKLSQATDPQRADLLAKKIKKVEDSIDGATKNAENLGKSLRKNLDPGRVGLEKLLGGMDRFGKAVIGLGLSAFERGLHSLYRGIYKVWELQERWTRAMGGFNVQVGGVSPALDTASRSARRWEGTMYGLTNQFGQGVQMMAEFVEGFGRMFPDDTSRRARGLRRELDSLSMTGLALARAYGLGGRGSGELLETIRRTDVGEVISDAPEQAERQFKKLNQASIGTLKLIAKNAIAGGLSVTSLAKDVAGAKDWMAAFGKEGRKTLIDSIAFAKTLGVSLKSLRGFTEVTDTFEGAATAAAKLNTVFGTGINALELMLEDNPGKRLEMVRRSFEAQGRSTLKLRQEVTFLARTLNIAEDEVRGFLQSGMSWEQFQERQAKVKERQVSQERLVRGALAKTAQTMFAFNAAWDRITVAISKLIKPFTDMLGLTRAGGKEFRTFGGVMSAVFKRLEEFILEVARNPAWQGFMKTLATDAERLFRNVSDVARGPKLREWLEVAVKAGRDFYSLMKSAFEFIVKGAQAAAGPIKGILGNLKTILALWAASKVVGGGLNLLGLAGGLGAAGLGGSAALAARAGTGLLGAGAGIAAGAGTNFILKKTGREQNETSKTGSYVGGVAGGVLGSIAGPFGAIAGAAAGSVIGSVIGQVIGKGSTPRQTRAEKELTEVLKKRKDAERAQGEEIERVASVRRTADVERSLTDQKILSLQKEAHGKRLTIQSEEQEVLAGRIKELQKAGMSTRALDRTMAKLSAADGPVQVTATELQRIISASRRYQKSIDELNEATQKQTELLTAKEKNRFDIETRQLRKSVKKDDEVVKKREAELKGFDKLTHKQKEALLTEADKQEIDKETIRQANIGFTLDARKSAVEALARRRAVKNLEDARATRAEHLKVLAGLETKHEDQIFKIKVRNEILQSEEFKEFRRQFGLEGARSGDALRALKGAVRDNPYFKGRFGGFSADVIQGIPEFAQGGVVRGPTLAVVGEAGPEAIVPLRALAGPQRPREPVRFQGEADARSFVEGSLSGASGGRGRGRIITQVADVNLDGRLVGRALVRTLLEGEV